MNIAIVILNWNGKSLLEKFLPSVLSYSKGASIYVADNASTDDSISFIKNNYPQISIIQNTSNGGYAKGYNDALSNVDASIYCLLNSDVEVTKDWLQPIEKLFNSDANIAAIQPKILDYKKKTHFEYAGAGGGFIDKFGYPYCRGRLFDTLEVDNGQYNDSIPVFWASGACLFIKAAVFEEVGKLDEDFFAHQEEIDLCWRIKNHGYSIMYEGASTVYHLGGATLDSMNPKKTFLNFRNNLYLLLKNVPGYSVWIILFSRMVLDGLAFFHFIVQGKINHAIAIPKAHFSFYLNLKKVNKKRTKTTQKEPYYLHFSVVWQYFIQKKRYFSSLIY